MKIWLLSGLKPQLVLLGLLPALAGGLLAVVAAGAMMGSFSKEQATASTVAAAARAEALLADLQRRMGAHAAGVAVRAQVQQHTAAGERTALGAALGASYAALREGDPALAVLEVTDARGKVVFRAHNPAQHGDDKSAEPFVAAALRGQPASGAVVSPTSGQVALGATVPIVLDGRRVGTVKAAANLTQAAAVGLGRVVGAEVLLVGSRGVSASTLADPGPLPDLLGSGADTGGAPFELNLAAHGAHLTAVVPIRNLEGAAIAAMVVATPLAPWRDALNRMLLVLALVLVVVLALAGPCALWFGGRLAKPLVGMSAVMTQMAAGRLDIVIPGQGRRDEVGHMATALEAFRQQAEANHRLEAAAAADRALKLRRQEKTDRQVAAFNVSASGVMHFLEQAATQMSQVATSVVAQSGLAQSRADTTAQGATSASADLTMVAAAVEELNVSVGEITRQVAQAAATASDAVGLAASTDGRMRDLATSGERIGDVVRLIADIAQRTNLLALNATIEAARAGEAGKGFAVVASEVKALAAQTARATEEVTSQIGAMRGSTTQAVAAVGQMSAAIDRIAEVATAIAAAVEQQGAATRDIAGNVQTVASLNAAASEAMQDVCEASRETAKAGHEVVHASNDLQDKVANLRQEIDGFLGSLAEEQAERRRYQRLPANGRKALLRQAGQPDCDISLLDVSRVGAACACPRRLQVGSPLELLVAGLAPMQATVARSDDGAAALLFDDNSAARATAEALIQMVSGPEARAA